MAGLAALPARMIAGAEWEEPSLAAGQAFSLLADIKNSTFVPYNFFDKYHHI
jgi:hypothetical protein